MSAPTPEQSARFYELAKAARRPRWVPVEIWPDILAGALARCFEPSEKRKPIFREPPLAYGRYLVKVGKQWDPEAYFWEQRLREELNAYKTRDRKPNLAQTAYGAVTFQPIANSAEHAVIAEETADSIYSSLDERSREIARLAADGCSAREIERRTGVDRGKVSKLLHDIGRQVDEMGLAHYAISSGNAPDAEAEWSPRSYVTGAPAAFRSAGSSDWTINRDLARLLPPREAKPYRVSRTPGELAAGRAEVKQALANIDTEQRRIATREKWLRGQLDHLDPEQTSLGKMEREFARRGLKPTKRAKKAATAAPAGEEGVAA